MTLLFYRLSVRFNTVTDAVHALIRLLLSLFIFYSLHFSYKTLRLNCNHMNPGENSENHG
jgi:hypothetical protein